MASFSKRLLWRFSGVTISVLEQPGCETDHNKHAAVGATVFLTGILAGLSGGYAFYRAFGSYRTAIPLGIFWGILIFNLDRFMVMSIKKKDVTAGNWRAWLKAKLLEVVARNAEIASAIGAAIHLLRMPAKPIKTNICIGAAKRTTKSKTVANFCVLSWIELLFSLINNQLCSV